MWFVLQSRVIFAVMTTNVHWQWTPNGYLAGLIGIVLAYGLTALVSASFWGVSGTSRGTNSIQCLR